MKRKITTHALIFIMTMLFICNIPFEKYFPIEMNDKFFVHKITKQLKSKKAITIFSTLDVADYKIITFYTGESPQVFNVSCAKFKKNTYDYYCLEDVKRFSDGFKGIKINDFYLNNTTIIAIISNNEHLAKVEYKLKSSEVIVKEIITNPSVTYIEIPKYSYSGYNFYDKKGNIIR